MEIFKLFGSILIDNDQANKSIDSTGNKAMKMAKSFGGGLKSAVKFGAGVVGAAAAAGAAVGALVMKTSEAANAINKFSQQTGTTTDEYQKLDQAFKTVGWSMEDAAGDFSALGEKALEAIDPTSGAAESFKQLGVSVTDASGKLKSQGQIFNEVIKGLQGVENETRRNAIASELLSTTGEELVPILNMTNEEFVKLKESSKIIESDDLKVAEEFNGKWEKIKNQFTNVGMTLGVKLMPIVMKFFDFIDKNMPVIDKVLSALFEIAGFLFDNLIMIIETYLMPIVETVFNWIAEHMPIIKAIFKTTFEFMGFVIQSVIELIQTFIIILKGLGSVVKFIFNRIKKVLELNFKIYRAIFGGIIDGIGWVIDKVKDALKWLGILSDEEDKRDQKEKQKGVRVDKGFGPDAYWTEPPTTSSNPQSTVNPDSTSTSINIEKMEVRKDSDINKIATELDNLKNRNKRAGGN